MLMSQRECEGLILIFLQPYDPKRSCWVPMSEGGYVEGTIESTEGDKVIVKIGKDEKKVLKKDQVQQVHICRRISLFADNKFDEENFFEWDVLIA